MATRDDVKVDFLEDPRIIEIEAPSTEIVMQDLVDTLRKKEDAFQGMPFEKLTNASGKEDLGGGVLVGLTVDLQNAQVSFEARRTPVANGSVTTGSGTPVNSPLGPTFNFVDTGADFIAAGIKRGSLAINFTDQSIADVIEVVSSTELRTRVLVNGSDNTWSIGDDYQVFNVTQCEAVGGNLVAVDENGARISSIFPTAFTQIVRTASSSATLQEQQDIQYASFGGGVTVDLTSLNSGTAFPVGTSRLPVNNFSDALDIANTRGFTTLYVIGDATFDGGLDFTGFNIVGESESKSTFTLDPSANVFNSEFSFATVQGTLDGGNLLTDCVLNGVNYVDGFVERCILNGTTTLSGLDTAHFLDCYSGIPGVSTPVIDFQGSGAALAMRNYNGGVQLVNKTGAGAVSIDMNSGQVKIADTVTTGTIVLRGVGIWTDRDTYTGGANVTDQLITTRDVQYLSFGGGVNIDPVNGDSGTEYPIGTQEYPVDNLSDAVTIASQRNFKKIFISSDLTINNEDLTEFYIGGVSANQVTLTFDGTATLNKTIIENCKLEGTAGGSGMSHRLCRIGDYSIANGSFKECGFSGTLTATGPNTSQVLLVDCFGITLPTFDGNGDGPILTTIRYTGSLALQNKTGSSLYAVSMIGGNLILQPTVGGSGSLIVGGQGTLQNLGSSININNTLVTSDAGIVSELNSTEYDGVTFDALLTKLLSMATGRIVESSSGVFDFYEQDNTTISFTLTKSGSQRTRS